VLSRDSSPPSSSNDGGLAAEVYVCAPRAREGAGQDHQTHSVLPAGRMGWPGNGMMFCCSCGAGAGISSTGTNASVAETFSAVGPTSGAVAEGTPTVTCAVMREHTLHNVHYIQTHDTSGTNVHNHTYTIYRHMTHHVTIHTLHIVQKIHTHDTSGTTHTRYTDT
jgi:hypothetical protein